tara:strand:+ start:1574 stop:1993 length:420 start_codon:yes stop_codon:yes gene_type:complete
MQQSTSPANLEELSALVREVAADWTIMEKLFELIPDGVVVCDHHGIILYASPSWRRILGYEPEELVGRSVADIAQKDTRNYIQERFRALVQDGAELVTFAGDYMRQGGQVTTLDWLASVDEEHVYATARCLEESSVSFT